MSVAPVGAAGKGTSCSMQPLPIQSRVCEDRARRLALQSHIERLEVSGLWKGPGFPLGARGKSPTTWLQHDVSPRVDMSPPVTFPHLKVNYKRILARSSTLADCRPSRCRVRVWCATKCCPTHPQPDQSRDVVRANLHLRDRLVRILTR